MKRTEAVAWVLSVCTALRLSQAKTRAHLTPAAPHGGRVSLAARGRQLAGKAAGTHRIKRAWRCCANARGIVSDARGGVIAPLGYRRQKSLLVALDWTDLRAVHADGRCGAPGPCGAAAGGQLPQGAAASEPEQPGGRSVPLAA